MRNNKTSIFNIIAYVVLFIPILFLMIIKAFLNGSGYHK